MTLDLLGWNERWQKEFAALGADGLVPGRVIGEHRSHYQVATDATEVSAGVAGRLRNIANERSDLPGVGDFVALRLATGDGQATIEAVLPRISALIRKAAGENRPQLLAANIDVVFIMTTPDADLNLLRLERYLALVRDSGAAPVIVINKADLTRDAVEITGQIAKALLVHLTQTALAGYQDGKTATIAANVLVVRPNEDHASSISSRTARHEIDIDGDRIGRFLRTEEGQEASVLIGFGVKLDTIKPLAERDDRKKKRRPRDFVPDCSPTHALEVLQFIHKHGSVAPEGIPHPTTLTNLQSLKLIEKDEQGNFVPAIASRYADPLFLMQRAVSLAECIKVARTVLALNPGARGSEIADAVALELCKEWEVPGTKVRNGNAIKRWTLWLEPYLIDPDSSSYAAAQVAYSRSKKVTKGAPPVIRKKLAAELRTLVEEGKSKSQIAKIFNVSPATIGNWKRQLRLK